MKTKNVRIIRSLAVYFAVLAVAVSAALAGTPQVISPGSPAPDLTFKDQFDKETKLISEYKGQTILIIAWDRVGNDYLSNWMTGVRKVYPGGPNRAVTFVFLANFKGAPGFLQDNIKRKYQKTTDGKQNGAILLDWDGTFAKTYGFHDDVANAYLVDGKGILRATSFGKGTAEELQPILREIGNVAASTAKDSNSTEARH
jgi:AhpC/TSA family